MHILFGQNNFKSWLLLFFLSFNILIGYSQKLSNIPLENINVYKNTLFIGKSNIVIIHPSSYSMNKLIVTISGGDIVPMDITSGMYYVTVKKIGISTIKVFKQQGETKILLYSKNVVTKKMPLTKEEKELRTLSIQPELTIAGFKGKRIPLNIIKGATELSINHPFKIKSVVIYFSGSYSSDAIAHTLTTNVFDEDLLKFWKRINVGSVITIDAIKVTDETGKIYQLEGFSYVVTDNK